MQAHDKELQQRIDQKLQVRAFELHALESNPLTCLYHVLWEGSTHWSLTHRVTRPSNKSHFRLRVIPDTIVWENNIPKGWYRYEEEDEDCPSTDPRSTQRNLHKKGSVGGLRVGSIKKEKVDTKRIEAVFAASAEAEHSIVAVHMCKAAEEGSEAINVNYLTTAGLRQFLFAKNRGKGTCILQQWVAPQNRRHNDVLQAVWAPGMKCLVDRRQNIHDLDDPRVSAQQRAVTFDGPPHLSVEVNCSPQLLEKVRRTCASIAEHFEANTCQGPKLAPRYRLSRLVCLLKVNPAGRLIILGIPSARVSKVGRTKDLYVALDLAPKYISTSDVLEPQDEAQLPQRSVGPYRRTSVAHTAKDSVVSEEHDDFMAWLEGRGSARRISIPACARGGSLTNRPVKSPVRGHPAGWTKRGSTFEHFLTTRGGKQYRPPSASDVFKGHEMPSFRGTGDTAPDDSTMTTMGKKSVGGKNHPAALWRDKTALWARKGGGFILRSIESPQERKEGLMDSPRRAKLTGSSVEREAVSHIIDQEREVRGDSDYSPVCFRSLLRKAVELGDEATPEQRTRLRVEYLRSLPSEALRDVERMEYIYLTVGDRVLHELPRHESSPPPTDNRAAAKRRWRYLSRAVATRYLKTKAQLELFINDMRDVVYQLESHLMQNTTATARLGRTAPFFFSLPSYPSVVLPFSERFIKVIGAEETAPYLDGSGTMVANTVSSLSVGSAPSSCPWWRVAPIPTPAPGHTGYVVHSFSAPIHQWSIEVARIEREVTKVIKVREAAVTKDDAGGAVQLVFALDSLSPKHDESEPADGQFVFPPSERNQDTPQSAQHDDGLMKGSNAASTPSPEYEAEGQGEATGEGDKDEGDVDGTGVEDVEEVVHENGEKGDEKDDEKEEKDSQVADQMKESEAGEAAVSQRDHGDVPPEPADAASGAVDLVVASGSRLEPLDEDPVESLPSPPAVPHPVGGGTTAEEEDEDEYSDDYEDDTFP